MKISIYNIMFILFFLFLYLFLSGCTEVGPAYVAPHTKMPAHWQEKPQGRIQEQADVDMAAWWRRFKDPTLNYLISQAMSSNQDIMIAETRIREARAKRVLVGSGRSPQIAATGAYTSLHTGENASLGKMNQELFQAGFDADWELDIFGGVRRATEAAEAGIAATVENKRDVLVTLAAEVARNYIELCASRERLTIAKETISLQKKVVEIAEKRYRAGFGSELEFAQARTQLALTMAEVPGFKALIARSMHQILFLLGRQPESEFFKLAMADHIPAVPSQIPVNLPSTLLRQRPDIRKAERNLAAATAEIGVATADLFPKFSLSMLFGLETVSLSHLIASTSKAWKAGPKVQWSLFNGGKTKAGIEVSKSRRDRARTIYEKTVLGALVEVEDALVTLARERQTCDTLQTAVAAGRQAADIANGRYDVGLVDLLNVLESERALYRSQDQLVQSRQRLALDMVAVYKALGGGWRPVEKQEGAVISGK